MTEPEATFTALAAGHRRMFWLDGGGGRAWSGSRSLLGWLEDEDVSLTYDAAAREVRRHTGSGAGQVAGEDIFAALTQELARDAGDASVLWVGYFGYACRPDLPAQVGGGVPDAVWMRCPRHRVVAHEPGPPTTPAAGQRVPRGGPSPEEYAGWFDRVQRQLHLGNTYEVNLTYRQAVESGTDPVTAYLRLRAANPAPYAGYLQHDGLRVLSASPERFATLGADRWLETRPIKGTTPRGQTPAQDAEQRDLLATDPRYRAENLMIVDLLRNDLSLVCEVGTVAVPDLMRVESYAGVHQLVSTVRGHLRPGLGAVEALRALFPAGSMTGAPKLRTMQVITEVETTPRGVYAGALGWVSGDGRADLGVVIRTLVAQPAAASRWRYELGTGGGVTVRSDAPSELEETRWKAAGLLGVLDP